MITLIARPWTTPRSNTTARSATASATSKRPRQQRKLSVASCCTTGVSDRSCSAPLAGWLWSGLCALVLRSWGFAASLTIADMLACAVHTVKPLQHSCRMAIRKGIREGHLDWYAHCCRRHRRTPTTIIFHVPAIQVLPLLPPLSLSRLLIPPMHSMQPCQARSARLGAVIRIVLLRACLGPGAPVSAREQSHGPCVAASTHVCGADQAAQQRTLQRSTEASCYNVATGDREGTPQHADDLCAAMDNCH